MTQIQQQRLIGAALLVSLIVLLAYFVLSKVGNNQAEQELSLPEPIEFSSIIEPLDDTIDSAEAFVDADLLTDEPAETIVAQNYDAQPETDTQQLVSPSATPVPAPETVPTPSVPAVEPEVEAPASLASQPEPKPEETTTSATPPPAAVPAPVVSDPLATTWFIQVGSFSIQKNANDLKEKLEQLNYQPYIENSQTSSGLIYRVRLPASQDRSELEAISARIQQELNLSPQIITQ